MDGEFRGDFCEFFKSVRGERFSKRGSGREVKAHGGKKIKLRHALG